MTIGVNPGVAASTPAMAKAERGGAKANGDEADFGAALGLSKSGDRHGDDHKDAASAPEQEAGGWPRPRGASLKSGARGEGSRADGTIKAPKADLGDPQGKTPATPIAAIMLARDLEVQAQRVEKGSQTAEQAVPRGGMRGSVADPHTPDIKIDPASLAAAERAARNAAGRPQSAMPNGQTAATLSANLLVSGDQAEAAAASRSETPAGTAKLSGAAALTLSLTSTANQGQPTPAPGDPAVLPAARDFLQTLAANADGKRSQPDGFAKRQDAKSERVTVVAQQNIPAPIAQPTASTATGLANLIAADPAWRAAATPAFHPLSAQPGLASAHTLKIQLHPAELGMVTANLRLSGEHLTVELRVENGEAYRRLSADSEAIVKSLRAMGLDIDKVTIQQPQGSSSTQGRADGDSASAGFTPRDQQSFTSAHSGGNGAGAGRQHYAGNTNDGSYGSDDAASAATNAAGGGVYI